MNPMKKAMILAAVLIAIWTATALADAKVVHIGNAVSCVRGQVQDLNNGIC